jgi:hypothetical protein
LPPEKNIDKKNVKPNKGVKFVSHESSELSIQNYYDQNSKYLQRDCYQCNPPIQDDPCYETVNRYFTKYKKLYFSGFFYLQRVNL